MTPLYAYSLFPVLSVSLLLFVSLLLYGHGMVGLTLYCASIAMWSGVLVSLAFPDAPEVLKSLGQIGAFVSASFIHAAYDFSRQRNYTMVWLAYGVAAAITVVGIVQPGLLYAPDTLQPGPMFWPTHFLGLGAALVPLWQIARAYTDADEATRRQLRILAVSGSTGFLGAWTNSIAITHGIAVPYPMLMVLASLLLLTSLLRQIQQTAGRLLLDRSLLYAAMTAFLWAGFLFGMMMWMSGSAEPLLAQYRLGAFFLLCMAALAFEPIRLQVQQIASRVLLSGHVASQDLATELAAQEQRADQAARLAELGTFTSAVAHEIRNPLGVIAANVRLLEAAGSPPELCGAVREQVDRASAFVDDLLRYGRPRPLELRLIDLANTIRLAHSTAAASEADGAAIDWRGLEALPALLLEADQAQLIQVFAVFFSNASQALHGRALRVCKVAAHRATGEVCVEIEDSGPGIPEAIRGRLFEPFVTGRKREGKRSGTGLGLAIAKGIVERHHGRIEFDTSVLGGARFRVYLPVAQTIVPAGGERPESAGE